MLKSALLLYQKLKGVLEAVEFQVNLYDPCVANKIIDGELWHVDNLKMSRKNPWEITKLAKWLSSIYGNIGPTLEYLWMNLDYFTPGEVKISDTICE